MSKDYQERRTYRKSPGRQYGYDYDPLRSRSTHSQSGRSNNTTRSGSQLVQRPDPRRTRQLLRQSILANKTRSLTTDTSQSEESYSEEHSAPHQEYRSRYVSPVLPEDEEEDWSDYGDIDPDIGYEDPLDADLDYGNKIASERINAAPLPTRSRRPVSKHSRRPVPSTDYEDAEFYEDEDDDEYEYIDEKPKRKRKLSRRGLLIGIGTAAVATTGIAAYELGPKLPQAVNTVGSNIEHQVQDAFNKGLAQGADQARKEFITALDNLEGVTLDGAMAAARLTRVAYDVFVSPVIKFGSVVTGDVLTGMLNAFKTARGWLAGAYQDNATLQAIQKVLENWVDQASTMPKHIDAVT
ncbi:MAG: hypothetical protein J2P37_32255, partial [Ktedonobacteraceae bacterium]|nr:hypothetical protein [Ktedonobacteraceae bacterium]